MEKFVIVFGKFVRVIFIDVYVFDYGGNFFDVSGIGVIVVFFSMKLLKVNYNEEIGEVEIFDEYEFFLVNYVLIFVIFVKIGNFIVVDLSFDEECVMDGRFIIMIDEMGYILVV